MNQFRQTLADIASSDPVGEEGLGFGETAGAGTVATSSQQNQMAQQAAAMDPTMGTGQAPTAEAAEQQGEAANAQADAQKQTQQAQRATAEGAKKPAAGGKPGTTVSVKTSTLLDAVKRPLVGAGHAMGEGIAQHMQRAGSDAVRGGMKAVGEAAKTPKALAAGGAALGVAAGAKAHSTKKQNDRDKTQKQILEAVQRMGSK
jgi:hypothetical protein